MCHARQAANRLYVPETCCKKIYQGAPSYRANKMGRQMAALAGVDRIDWGKNIVPDG
jgi:hypothetical protein